MGQICFGTQNVVGARIDGRADQDWTVNSARGTHLRFLTCDNGTTTLDERMRITNAGIIQCGTSGVLKAEINNAVSGHQFISQCSDNNNGFEIYQQHGSTSTRNTLAVYDNRGSSASKQLAFAVVGNGNVSVPNGNIVMGNTYGIDFSPTGDGSGTDTSELFDDYEEGTWLPTLAFGGGSTGLTYNSRSGSYVKIGSFVYCVGQLDLSAKGSSTGSAVFGGLPYTVGDHVSGSSQEGSGYLTWWQSMGTNLNYPTSFWVSESTTGATIYIGNGTAVQNLTHSDFNSSSQTRFVIQYRTAT